jgi:hypothetical protein
MGIGSKHGDRSTFFTNPRGFSKEISKVSGFFPVPFGHPAADRFPKKYVEKPVDWWAACRGPVEISHKSSSMGRRSELNIICGNPPGGGADLSSLNAPSEGCAAVMN